MARSTIVVLIALAALFGLAATAISRTIGWAPVLGPKARPTTNRHFRVSPQRIARGEYIVNHVSSCADCHSPADWTDQRNPKPLQDKHLSGQVWPMPDFPGRMTVPNITPDRKTGIGTWSDDEIARAIREGIRKDGRALFPMMPYRAYREMSDEDVESIVVYLRSIPSVQNEVPRLQVKFPISRLINTFPQPVNQPVVQDASSSIARGKYLVKIATCGGCHTVRDDHEQPIPGLELAGGEEMTGAWGKATAPNITPDETGIGYYTKQMFVEAMRTGKVGGVRPLNPVMPWQKMGQMTDEDLGAIYDYLRTVKPVKHYVNGVDGATVCRKCGKKHGLGSQN